MPISGKKVKVAQSDFPNIMSWEEANNACKSLGKGWRLPTMAELEIIGKHLDEIGGFCALGDDTYAFHKYWSSDKKKGTENSYHYANFFKYDGKLDFTDWMPNDRSYKYKVRAVKTTK